MIHKFRLIDAHRYGCFTYYTFECIHCDLKYRIVKWLFWGSPVPGDQITKVGPCPGNRP